MLFPIKGENQNILFIYIYSIGIGPFELLFSFLGFFLPNLCVLRDPCGWWKQIHMPSRPWSTQSMRCWNVICPEFCRPKGMQTNLEAKQGHDDGFGNIGGVMGIWWYPLIRSTLGEGNGPRQGSCEALYISAAAGICPVQRWDWGSNNHCTAAKRCGVWAPYEVEMPRDS